MNTVDNFKLKLFAEAIHIVRIENVYTLDLKIVLIIALDYVRENSYICDDETKRHIRKLINNEIYNI